MAHDIRRSIQGGDRAAERLTLRLASTDDERPYCGMDPYQAVISKRDLRHYTDQPVSDEVLGRLLQAARMAGSGKNREANRLMVFREPGVKAALADAGDYASWIGRSPLIIGVVTPNDADRPFDVGRMAQNMMVVGHADGLASCPVTLNHQDVVRKVVGLPEDMQMRMVMTFGWPAEDAPPSPLKRTRVALDDLVRYDAWS